MACSEVAFLQTARAHFITKVLSQCHYSLVFTAGQIENNLSPIAKKF